jgi:polyhydroxyalkanoate synthesis regulator phasin
MTERELTFRILTTAETTALDQTATALADVARGADDLAPGLDSATRGLDDLDAAGRTAAGTLDDVDSAVAGVDLDQLGTDAKETSRKVDDAFDAMGRSAHTGAGKVDDSTDSIKRSMGDVREEASATAAETAQSFGSTGDIGDALQELAVVAPGALGPLGLAFGTVAAIGVGLFRTKTEALKERVTELVDQMIAAGGRLSEQNITDTLANLSKDGTLADLKETADAAGQSYRDLARARAGDEAAAKRGMDAARAVEKALLDQADAGAVLTADQEIRLRATRDYIQAMGEGSDALALAKEATDLYSTATGHAGDELDNAKRDGKELRDSLDTPITANVKINAPTSADFSRIRQDLNDGIGPIVVDVRLPSDLFSRPRK